MLRRRAIIILALVATVAVGWILYSARQQQFQHNFRVGPINTSVVYKARVMPYIIDNDGACAVPGWLERGVYVAKQPCEDGVHVEAFGKSSSWWNSAIMNDDSSATGHAGLQKKWTTSIVDEDTDPFMHALLQCDRGSHMVCLIMELSKGPFHSVRDPLETLTDQTMSPYTNEDTVYRCGPSYKDCVALSAGIVERLLFRNYNASFSDEEFEAMVKDVPHFFFNEMEW